MQSKSGQVNITSSTRSDPQTRTARNPPRKPGSFRLPNRSPNLRDTGGQPSGSDGMTSMAHKSVGIKDVASRAGVSIGSVSHVLNHPERVSAATRQRVSQAID